MTSVDIFKSSKNRRILFPAALAVCAALSAGCSPSASARPGNILPGSNAIAGWSAAAKAQTYNRETLFDYINGSSEYFFTYTFEEVEVCRYAGEGGGSLNAEVWRLAVAEDAFGLFSGRTGGEAVAVGGANEAILEPGSRLVFWQERYYVSLTAIEAMTDTDLRLFAEFISKALPTGGGKPEILGRLPADGLIPGSEKFFHLELAIQDRLWLGGENLLGLGADTDAVAARYRSGAAEWQLLLVQYPDAARAEAGVQGVRNGGLEDFIAADANGPLLGAAFGLTGDTPAAAMLSQALGR
ncbi:MAG: hypothetical protein JW748_00390 [Anaerolineales bacterium]|nr:hypothetical protein [Anaerolineales bacterium]